MSYKELEVKLDGVVGVCFSMAAMRKPKGSVSDSVETRTEVVLGESDAKLAGNLVRAGNDHAKAMRGVVAYVEVKMQTGFMIEFETYRIGAECLSTSSTMHGELKNLKGPELATQKQEDLVDKVYDRSLTMSYQVLRSMYRARRRHRHPDWRIFCSWIETLPYFDKLIFPEFKTEEKTLLYER